LEDRQPFLQFLLKRSHISTVTCCKNHQDIGFDFADAPVDMRPAQFGQNNIQKKKIDLIAATFKLMQPLLAVGGENQVVAEVLRVSKASSRRLGWPSTT